MSSKRFGAALTLAALAERGPAAPAEPTFVLGEVIVAFRKGTEPAGIVTRAAAGDSADAARLEAYVAAVGTEIGIPTRMRRLASGGDVLLAIDFAELTARLMSRLRADARVLRAAPVPEDKRAPPGWAEVRVDFEQGSAEARALRASAAGPPEEGRPLREATDRVARALGVALSSRVTQKRQFLVAVDAEAGTRELVERLRRRPDVAYAQPNFLVRKLSGV